MALTMKDLAEHDKKISLIWATNAVHPLAQLDTALKHRGSPASFSNADLPGFARIRNALQTHFNINTAADQSQLVADILARYRLAITALKGSAGIFVNDTTSAEAAKGTPAHVPFGSGRVNFTPAFKPFNAATGDGFGQFARAAMVLHEPFHIVDHPDASTLANHVHEGSPTYATTPAANQVHNAHSYASFAQHMNFGRDTRFGATKRQF